MPLFHVCHRLIASEENIITQIETRKIARIFLTHFDFANITKSIIKKVKIGNQIRKFVKQIHISYL